MRRIVAFNRVSVDGYFATTDGKLDWAVPEDQLEKEAASGLTEAATMLFGRKTYQMFESFWPNAAKESGTAPDPHAKGRRSPELAAMAKWINEAEKIVFSRTLEKVTWQNSRLIQELDPKEIDALKRTSGGDIMLFGSGSIASTLTEHHLIDEYQYIVNPILLGDGKLLIRGVPNTLRVKLVESKSYPSGNVKLRYEKAG
jgi:dihydrofolate reductase